MGIGEQGRAGLRIAQQLPAETMEVRGARGDEESDAKVVRAEPGGVAGVPEELAPLGGLAEKPGQELAIHLRCVLRLEQRGEVEGGRGPHRRADDLGARLGEAQLGDVDASLLAQQGLGVKGNLQLGAQLGHARSSTARLERPSQATAVIVEVESVHGWCRITRQTALRSGRD